MVVWVNQIRRFRLAFRNNCVFPVGLLHCCCVNAWIYQAIEFISIRIKHNWTMKNSGQIKLCAHNWNLKKVSIWKKNNNNNILCFSCDLLCARSREANYWNFLPGMQSKEKKKEKTNPMCSIYCMCVCMFDGLKTKSDSVTPFHLLNRARILYRNNKTHIIFKMSNYCQHYIENL